ncbi:MAG TPA: tetratricopeptide repeat protein [Thermoanaerobaculia bacterium]|nr:tetratricopeptide repeat protein [Thermoanaerobaculia bacterium]
MTTRHVAIAAAVLLHLFALSLDAQLTQQMLIQPTPQARQQLTKTLQEYRAKNDVHGEAITLLQLGMAEAALGNADGARSNLLEAVGKMRSQNDPMGAWLALFAVAQLEVTLGRPAEALPHVEKALALLNETKVSTAPFSLRTMKTLGSASGFSIPPGLDDSSAGMMKPMLIQYSFEPMTHDLYGSVLTQVGQLDKAEAELKAAAAGSIQSQGMYDFSIESHFGDLRVRQQRYDAARTHYTKALSAVLKLPLPPMADQQIKAGIYDRLARLETIAGRPEEATRWFEKARGLGKSNTEKR